MINPTKVKGGKNWRRNYNIICPKCHRKGVYIKAVKSAKMHRTMYKCGFCGYRTQKSTWYSKKKVKKNTMTVVKKQQRKDYKKGKKDYRKSQRFNDPKRNSYYHMYQVRKKKRSDYIKDQQKKKK